MTNSNQILHKIKDELEQILKEEIGAVPVVIETAENSCSCVRDCTIRFSIPRIKESDVVSIDPDNPGCTGSYTIF